MKKSRFLINLIFNLFVVLSFTSVCLASGNGIELPGDARDTLTEITQILFLVGAAVCIGKCIHIGILYVTSSAADKSNAKMAMIPWLIGTFVCFGASTIGTFIINLFNTKKSVLSY